jgi:hypothetical protein
MAVILAVEEHCLFATIGGREVMASRPVPFNF